MGQWASLAIFIAIPMVSALALDRMIRPDVKGWYRHLRQPDWKPPNWAFGVVWPILYTCMGTASWLVWRKGGFDAQAVPLGVYAVQLALNLAWPPIFFSGHKLATATLDSAALLVGVAASTKLFWDVDPRAGQLMVPYLLWTAYATALSAWIWNHNPRADTTRSLDTQPKETKMEHIKGEIDRLAHKDG
jgi:tryptophan-rich sensory protein